MLLVEGDQSPTLFHIINDALAETLPNVSRQRFSGVCHVAPFFAADAFNDAVKAFIEKQGDTYPLAGKEGI